MHAMILEAPGTPLRYREAADPTPGAGQMLLRVRACVVCRTDLHILDGELPHPKLPLILGHEIVGTVAGRGVGASRFALGERVGVPWLGWSCGHCAFCLVGLENLCDDARYTGYQLDGGYAEYCVADERFCFALPPAYADAQAAPLLCAGLIGYRAYRFAHESRIFDSWRLGLYGFGASAHLLTQIAVHEGAEVYAFTRAGDAAHQQFARTLGAVWAGASETPPPAPLDAAILFAPVGALIPQALRAVRKAGVVVAAGIHMSAIPSFPYDILWGERVVRSVANLTRRDGDDLLALAAHVPLHIEITTYPLRQANDALRDLREGRFNGAAVLVMD